MSYQTEQQLEDGFIKRLVKNEYERILIKDTDALADNFRKQMNRMNAEGLKGQELSDKEFERLLLLIEGKSVFESAKILRQKKDMVRDDGSIIYIQFFNPQRGDKNHFQVTNQVTAIGRYTNRYDVTLLVNGLPVVQIGLKRRGLHFNESYNQILRYRKDSYGGLYNFLQLFIVTGSGRIINNTGYMNQKSRKNKFSKDMVLFGKLRLYLKKYWFTECEGMCSTEIWVLTT